MHPRIHPDTAGKAELTMMEKILNRIKKHEKVEYSAKDFLDISDVKQVIFTLRELAEKGELIRTKIGFYALPDRVSEIEPPLEDKIVAFAKDCEPSAFSSNDIVTFGKGTRQVKHILDKLIRKGTLAKISRGRYMHKGRSQ